MTASKSSRAPRIPWRGVILVVSAILLVWAWSIHANSIRLSEPADSPLATSLILVDPTAGEVTLESFRGKVVLLNLWASWCPPCRREIPRLNRLAAGNGEDLVVLGVNVEQLDPARLSRVRDELGIDYRVLVPGGELGGVFSWDGLLPYTWLIDKQGRVRAAHGGLPVERSLRRACEKLLGE